MATTHEVQVHRSGDCDSEPRTWFSSISHQGGSLTVSPGCSRSVGRHRHFLADRRRSIINTEERVFPVYLADPRVGSAAVAVSRSISRIHALVRTSVVEASRCVCDGESQSAAATRHVRSPRTKNARGLSMVNARRATRHRRRCLVRVNI